MYVFAGLLLPVCTLALLPCVCVSQSPTLTIWLAFLSLSFLPSFCVVPVLVLEVLCYALTPLIGVSYLALPLFGSGIPIGSLSLFVYVLCSLSLPGGTRPAACAATSLALSSSVR